MSTKQCMICEKKKVIEAFAYHPDHPERLDNLMNLCDLCLNTFKINKHKASGFVLDLTEEECKEIMIGLVVTQ